LAGEVVAAAVILNPEQPIEGLADSKKLSEAQREKLYALIYERALAVGIGVASVEEIDRLNILHASMLAMERAVANMPTQPEYVVVDGNRLPNWQRPAQAVVKGDSRVTCISAASIVAKVCRDRQMQVLAKQHPEYGFEKHKGYPTRAHQAALLEYGVTPSHRRSFAPVKRLLVS
jgi:ribonuclease HII